MTDSSKKSTPFDSESYEFLLARSLLMVKEYDRSWNWVFVVTLVVALLSTMLNIGAIAANEVNLGVVKLVISNTRSIKVFLCLASVSGACIFAYLHGFSWRAVYISKFLEEKGFSKAAVISEYGKWEVKNRPYFNLFHSICATLILVLQIGVLIVMPVWTLVSHGLSG